MRSYLRKAILNYVNVIGELYAAANSRQVVWRPASAA